MHQERTIGTQTLVARPRFVNQQAISLCEGESVDAEDHPGRENLCGTQTVVHQWKGVRAR
jgi:hypothetical protein